MKTITKRFIKAIGHLSYDHKLVYCLKMSRVNKELLYNYLIQGRITLEEYVQAIK